eukprot:3073296-Rhodomonas_salina.1
MIAALSNDVAILGAGDLLPTPLCRVGTVTLMSTTRCGDQVTWRRTQTAWSRRRSRSKPTRGSSSEP